MDHQLTLALPDEVYQPLLRMAQDSGQAVEAVASARLTEAVVEDAARRMRDLEGEAQHAKDPTARKPIWEVAAEIRRSVPEEEWARLPTDGAEQHDHYIYGTPKRPAPR